MHVPGRRLPLLSGQPLSPWTTTRPRMCISRGISKGSLPFTPASLPLACGPRRNGTLGLFPELRTRQGRTLPRASGRGRAMGTARITSLASASLLRRTHSLRATTRRNTPDTCPDRGSAWSFRSSSRYGRGSVKPSATPSVVRIHHLPLPAKTAPDQLKRGQGLSPSYAGVCGS